jgi:6-phosphogluconolactonase
MLRSLVGRDVPWAGVQLWQVDERVAPDGDADRNLTHLRESLLAAVPLAPAQVHAMPVSVPDLDAAVREYSAALRAIAGDPPVLDLVHLGLGLDGHTASLLPGDSSLDVTSADVALAGPYQGRRRMTLTFSLINRARRVLWVVTGADKAAMLRRLLNGDRTIPAARVCQDRALVLADRAATGD